MAGSGSLPVSCSRRSRATPVVVSSVTLRAPPAPPDGHGRYAPSAPHRRRRPAGDGCARPQRGRPPTRPCSSGGTHGPRSPARPAPRRRRRASTTGSSRLRRPARPRRRARSRAARSWPRGGRPPRPVALPVRRRRAAAARTRRARASGAGPTRSPGGPRTASGGIGDAGARRDAHSLPASMMRCRNWRVRGCSGSRSRLLRRALLEDPSLLEEADPVGDVAGEAHLVGDDHHRHPARAFRSLMTCSTPPISSGSSAAVISSSRSTSGWVASARTIATRCCWPPDSCSG
jgi:hypothetical protein